MANPVLKAPFPAFGGKSRVASLVWERLGDVVNFIEPFCNSAAVLLARPHSPRIETVNDLNCYVPNFWRAIAADKAGVAEHADWPVFEADLHARHRWLVLSAESAEFRERMKTDPDYYDPKIAGWWVWGACCWIGSGWCDTPASAEWDQLPKLYGYGSGCVPESAGLSAKLPDISGHAGGSGRGVNQSSALSQQVPMLSAGKKSETESYGGRLIHQDRVLSDSHRPQLADAYSRGRGVHGNDSAGTCAQRRAWLLDWFGRLSDRIRTVRVCCGHWRRVCDSFSVTTRLGVTGVFFDAPYKTHLADGTANRSADLYANDRSQDVNALVDEVIAYCVERGADPLMRIAACCYQGEGYEVLAELGWECVEWKAGGGYANRNKAGSDNAARERIWFSPACRKPLKAEPPMFAAFDEGGAS